jgi:Zn-dependent protease with chaperone function
MLRRLWPIVAVLTLACAPESERPAVDSQAVAREREVQTAMAAAAGPRPPVREENRSIGMVLAEAARLSVRLQEVSTRISHAAAPMCPDSTRPTIGLGVVFAAAFKEEFRQAARTAYGIAGANVVTAAVRGLPAERAGVMKGDVVTSVNDAPFIHSAAGEDALQRALAAGGAIRLGVERQGRPLAFTVTPVPICDMPVLVAGADDVNAAADGRKVVIFLGMLRFADSEDDLALVIGHELGHNLRHHIEAKRRNAAAGAMAGSVLDVLLATVGGIPATRVLGAVGRRMSADAYSTQFEGEADYIGLYLAARAGFAIEGGPEFWRRMGVARPGAITHAKTHPTTAERSVALAETIREIHDKQARGVELMPNEKR